MKERVQKVIAAAGLMSRRKAEDLISAGRVKVNGVPAMLGSTADPEADVITIDGKPLPRKEKQVYIMLHKPKGVLTAMSDDRGRTTVAELVTDCPVRVVPVGRLDYYSEGLLLMTNDGDAAFKIAHPSHLVEKEYLVWVTGFEDGMLEALSGPMVIEGYRIRPAKVRLHGREGTMTILSVTITEGRKRQVRLMCAQVGLRVHRLVRIREGMLKLGDLPPGKWRYLHPDEIEYLKRQ